MPPFLTLNGLKGHPEFAHLYLERGPVGCPANQYRMWLSLYLRMGEAPEEAARLARGRSYLGVKLWTHHN